MLPKKCTKYIEFKEDNIEIINRRFIVSIFSLNNLI